LVGKPEGMKALVKPRRRWEDNIKMDLKGVGWGHGFDRSVSEQGQVASCCESCNEPSDSIKCEKYFD
jgi:hypothetical protein